MARKLRRVFAPAPPALKLQWSRANNGAET